MNRFVTLILFMLLVVGGGSLIGMTNLPGGWYEALVKPSFYPPNWVFGPVWTLLYVMIAVAGWRTFDQRRTGFAMKAWFAQLLLNFAWSPVFFTLHSLSGAFAIILALLAAIVAFMIASWSQDRVAFGLFVPYLAWTMFATLLNGSLLWLN